MSFLFNFKRNRTPLEYENWTMRFKVAYPNFIVFKDILNLPDDFPDFTINDWEILFNLIGNAYLLYNTQVANNANLNLVWNAYYSVYKKRTELFNKTVDVLTDNMESLQSKLYAVDKSDTAVVDDFLVSQNSLQNDKTIPLINQINQYQDYLERLIDPKIWFINKLINGVLAPKQPFVLLHNLEGEINKLYHLQGGKNG